MRRDLVLEVLDAASEELFEDVLYTPKGGAQVPLTGAIFGVEVGAERFEMFGERMRTATHTTRALRAKFPQLARGDLIDDGRAWRVIDFEPIGDGREELMIALEQV
ncbi:head-tail joining protein [Pelagibacterium montanilacus]|uniref:head-tail joining protein n=1 Tax=Pelagibacterium montanilacus TaxID=2185280 RepID=UPI000F8EC9B8|nr:hypothetical protein [Pelagibacterium montanilacus]